MHILVEFGMFLLLVLTDSQYVQCTVGEELLAVGLIDLTRHSKLYVTRGILFLTCSLLLCHWVCFTLSWTLIVKTLCTAWCSSEFYTQQNDK